MAKIKKIVQDLIAYQGVKLTIEWYFNDSGKSEALEYFENMPLESTKKMVHLMEVLGDQGKLFNEEKFRHEGDHIYAFKPSPYRFLCFFFQGSKIIITNGFAKKTDKLPQNEKDKALKAQLDYITRVKLGKYYD